MPLYLTRPARPLSACYHMPDVFNEAPAPSHLLAPLKRGFQLALRSPFTSLPPAAIPASAALFEVSLKLLLFVNGLAEFSIYGMECQVVFFEFVVEKCGVLR